MKATLAFCLAFAPAGVAHAEEIVLKPLGEARLRYENVDQAGLTEGADALTLRVRAGIEAKAGRWSAIPTISPFPARSCDMPRRPSR